MGVAWRVLGWAVLVALPLAAAVVVIQTLRKVGAHALPALVASPVVLIAGALICAVWLLPTPGVRVAGRRSPALAVAVAVAVVAAAGTVVTTGTVLFARWFTTSRGISATTTRRAAADDPPKPSRPGRVAWHLRSPRLQPDVLQSSGYTVVTDYNDDPHGNRAGELNVYDTATGRVRWYFQRADAVLKVDDLTADTVVVEADDLGGHRTVAGMDLRTGRRLWSAPLRPQRGPGVSGALIAPAAAGHWLYDAEQVGQSTATGARVEARSTRSGDEVWRAGFVCPVDAALAQSTTLVIHQECAPGKLQEYDSNRPRWSADLSNGAYAWQPGSNERMQIGQGIVAVPIGQSDGKTTGWIFYRMSDGHELWRQRATDRLFLAGTRVIEVTGQSELTVRDANTGRILWRSGPGRLPLSSGTLDNVVTSGDHLYALWIPSGLTHELLLTFDALAGNHRCDQCDRRPVPSRSHIPRGPGLRHATSRRRRRQRRADHHHLRAARQVQRRRLRHHRRHRVSPRQLTGRLARPTGSKEPGPRTTRRPSRPTSVGVGPFAGDQAAVPCAVP